VLEKVYWLKVWPQLAQRKRGMRWGALARVNEPWRFQRQPSLERWKRQSVRGQCGGTKGASALAMPVDHCTPHAGNNCRSTTYPLPHPGIAAACLTHLVSCATSRSSSWMSTQRASRPVPPGGTGSSDVPLKKLTLT